MLGYAELLCGYAELLAGYAELLLVTLSSYRGYAQLLSRLRSAPIAVMPSSSGGYAQLMQAACAERRHSLQRIYF